MFNFWLSTLYMEVSKYMRNGNCAFFLAVLGGWKNSTPQLIYLYFRLKWKLSLECLIFILFCILSGVMLVENLRGTQTLLFTLRFKCQHTGCTALLHVYMEWWWSFNIYTSKHSCKHIFICFYEIGILQLYCISQFSVLTVKYYNIVMILGRI
jgi:hypothetical protein